MWCPLGRRRLAGGGQLANFSLDSCVDEVEVCAQGLVSEGAPRWLAVAWIVQVVDNGVEPAPASVRRFSDIGDDHLYVAYIERAAELGITQGCGNGSRFCPDDAVTQAQMTAFLVRGLTFTEVVGPEMVVTVSTAQAVPVSQDDPVLQQVPQENPAAQDDPAPKQVPVVQETGDMLRHEFYYVDRVGLAALEVSMDVLANDDCITTCNVSIKYAPKVGTTTWDVGQQRLIYEVPEGTALPDWAVAFGYETDTSPWNAIATIVINEIPDTPVNKVYKDIAVGFNFWCAINVAGAIECQGTNQDGVISMIPAGSDYVEIAAGARHACARKTDNTVTCWGNNVLGESTDPGGTFKLLTAGDSLSCGIKTDNNIQCWGAAFAQNNLPPGAHKSISAQVWNLCVVSTDGDLSCWGETGNQVLTDKPNIKVQAVSNSEGHGCAILLDNTVQCWGSNASGQAASQSETFSAVAVGTSHSCGIKTNGTIKCWGDNTDQQTDSPPGTFSDISATGNAACALTADTGLRECWGTLS